MCSVVRYDYEFATSLRVTSITDVLTRKGPIIRKQMWRIANHNVKFDFFVFYFVRVNHGYKYRR